jgi:hypothetical protein
MPQYAPDAATSNKVATNRTNIKSWLDLSPRVPYGYLPVSFRKITFDRSNVLRDHGLRFIPSE